MADTLKSLFSGMATAAGSALLTAGGAEHITILRMKAQNVHATTTTTISIWRGSAHTDEFNIVKSISLAPGEALEWDPTKIMLAPGEVLYAQAGADSCIAINADGLSQV